MTQNPLNTPRNKPTKKRLIIGLLLLAMVLAVSGFCYWQTQYHSATASQTSNDAQKIVLKVASQKDSLRILLEASNALKDAPYRVEFISFASAGPSAQAVATQAADFAVVGEASLAFALASQAPIKVVGVVRTRVTDTAVAILVKKDSPYRYIADLLGKKITTTKGSVGHFLALAALHQAGYRGKDVQFIYLQPGEARTLLASGQADAWTTWDPYTSMAQLDGQTRVLVSGEKLFAGNIPLIANQQAITEKTAILQDFLTRIGKAYDWVNQHPQQFSAIQAKHTGLPLQVHLLSNQHGQPHRVAIDRSAINELQRSIDLYRKEELIQQPINASSAFDLRFNPSPKTDR